MAKAEGDMVLAQFDARVAETPDAIAVVDDRSTRSYAQLDREARAYSRLLRAAGARVESVVAVVAERSPQYVAMVLGVLRAGAAFMPLEPTTPLPRARLMCATARVHAIFAQPVHRGYAAELIDPTAELRPPLVEAVERDDGPDPALPERARAGIAYVIFTSGSTGTPKGAMLTDEGMSNHVDAKIADLELGPADAVGLTAPLMFDISVWQVLTALCAGGRVCVASPANLSEPRELAAWVERHRVTILELVPSFLAVVLDLIPGNALRERLRSLRLFIATGEALPIELVRHWYRSCPDIPLMNAYGPTECSDDVSHHVLSEAECLARGRVSIGRPILNTEIYILDEQGAPAGDGVEGEILIGGRGVGRGYIADPVRTALAFVPDHVSGRPGRRLYRTGDRGTRSSDGTLDYLGRRDRQVKVRGHRVELGDAEAELQRVPGVAAAACILAGERIRAFVTLRSGAGELARGGALLAAVRKSAPAWLVPQEVVVLDRMPTGSSGKVDYRALAGATAPTAVSPAADAERPASLGEVRQAFAEVLGVREVGDDDDFFRAGGDSLKAMQLLGLARTRFGRQGASLRGFMSAPTPRGMLAVLEAAEEPAPGEAPAAAPGALSAGQERLWFLEQLQPRHGSQLIRVVLTLEGPLDVAALQHALDAVVQRHEPLRTTFSQQMGVPTRTVWPRAQLRLQRVSGDGAPDLLGESDLSIRTAQPPLAAAQLRQLAPDRHVLTLVLHHVIADGWSLAVLGRDISLFYRRWLDGNREVAAPPRSYSDYVAEERGWLAGSEAAECERYWLGELAGAPLMLELPFDRPHPARADFIAACEVRELPEDESARLAELSRAMGATPFMAVVAAFYLALRRLARVNDLVVGIDSINRSWTRSDQLIGTFVNQLPVRLATSQAGFGDVLELTRRQCLRAYEHERLPFHKIVAAVNPPRRPGRPPLFQVKVTQQGGWRCSVDLPGIRITPAMLSEPVINLDLLLDVSEEGGRQRLELVYRPELLDANTAAAWADAIQQALCDGMRG